MADDRKPADNPDDTMPSEATPHNPGLKPKHSETAADTKPAAGAPYDKNDDPSQQPT